MSSPLRLTIAGFIGLFLHGVIVAAPGAFLPQWTESFGATVDIGRYYTTFLVSSLAGLYLVSRCRRRHPLFAGVFAAIALSLIFAALSPAFSGVWLAAIPIGFGDGALNLHCNSLVGELHAKRRILFLNWANATFGFGALSAPLLGIFLPWRIGLGVVAMLALVSVALAWQAPAAANFSPGRDRMPWREASPFLLVIMLYAGLESAIGTWGGHYLRHLGWSVAWSGALLSFYWAGLTVGRLSLGGWVSRRPVNAIRYLLFGAAIGVGITAAPPFAMFFALAAFCYGPTFATVFGLVQERCGHVALGYLFYASYIGKSSIPALFNGIATPTYLPYGFGLLALLLYLVSLKLP